MLETLGELLADDASHNTRAHDFVCSQSFVSPTFSRDIVCNTYVCTRNLLINL